MDNSNILRVNEEGIIWKAKWIWKNDEVSINDFVYFRKVLTIKKTVLCAKAYVSAHNHFELFINGIKVSGYVSPAPTHPQKSKYFLCYDFTDLINIGGNSFCATAHYIGGGGQNYVDGLPGFIFQCHICYEDGNEEMLCTDESWKVQKDTPFENKADFQQERKISAIENYDARKEEENWLLFDFNDHHWNKACFSHINHENWVMKPQTIPEGMEYELIIPEPVGVQAKGLQVFDAGKIISGWPRIELLGIEGISVKMRYSEDMNETGRVKHNVCNQSSENYYDQYTMRGKSVESWEPCFSYKAFRYVEITGYPEIILPENIKIVSAGTGLNYKGSFNSSNKLLNDIYTACIQTQKNNVQGQMTDCPHREQAQYLADSDLQAETFIYNFIDSTVLEKVLLDFSDAQNIDGSFPFVFPTNIENPRFDIRIPEWDMHFVTMLWKIYYAYNNINLLKKCYVTAEKVVSYFVNLQDDMTGLIPKAEGFPRGWNISDHPYPNIDETGNFLTVGNCLFFHVLELMSKISLVLGFDEDSKAYDKKAGYLKENIIKYLYDSDNKRFRDCYDSDQSHQGTNAVAYRYGLVPEGDKEKLLAYIVSMGFGCSTLLSLTLLRVLFENGKEKEAYSLLDTVEQPGWGFMIAKGYKTIWEGFQDKESHSHAWNAYPARIFVEYLVGIKATSPGFEKIDIKPYLPLGMQYAEGRIPTIKGDIFVRWDVKDENIVLKVEIPDGVTASICFPKPDTEVKTICGAGKYVFTV